MGDISELIDDFGLVTEIATDLSMHFGRVNTNDRRKRLSTYFLAKLVHNCVSLLKILPKDDGEEIPYFDFSSIASLGRNIIESTNLCWYYCIDDVDKDESDFRFILFDYHDTCTLLSMSDSFKWELDTTTDLENEKLTLKKALLECEQYKVQDSVTKKQLRQGRKASLYNQKELIELRCIDGDEFQGAYKLLSNHVHSTPNCVKSVVLSRLHGQEMDFVLCGLTLSYVCSFVAEMIKAVGNLWEMEFAKKDSEYLIESYSAQLYKVT
ncbi:hypothetical protein ABT56_12890 [Photobacterium aquae]|uniref:Uncharacterized protein n=1 Tax=Photobacterium aquae TaxID=1195763 RepID=A0A0J1GZY7_9GAMM|nr:DUF5677 domain-containing protein [Photobacterium aquae]KLV05089.1 hypothetical protein ABT56_12890 [Photobacterium aquae]